jgi:lipoate-protein ligase A
MLRLLERRDAIGIRVMRCVVLPYRIEEGPENMAMDEALLEHVAATTTETAVLRTYGWSVPTLSLGYFQRLADAREDLRWRKVPLLRRPTGGGAIWHDRELTYAVILPTNHPQAKSSNLLYRAVHGAILRVLLEHGLNAYPRGTPEQPESGGLGGKRPFLCFADRDPEDLVCNQFKVVGSAQRKRRGALLQHGSILLSASEPAPELPGICDLADVDRDAGYWAAPIEQSVLSELDLEASQFEIPANVHQRAGELERLLYRDPCWTARR